MTDFPSADDLRQRRMRLEQTHRGEAEERVLYERAHAQLVGSFIVRAQDLGIAPKIFSLPFYNFSAEWEAAVTSFAGYECTIRPGRHSPAVPAPPPASGTAADFGNKIFTGPPLRYVRTSKRTRKAHLFEASSHSGAGGRREVREEKAEELQFDRYFEVRVWTDDGGSARADWCELPRGASDVSGDELSPRYRELLDWVRDELAESLVTAE